MSLIGAVSLTNKQGLFLGSVNLDNLNLDPEQIVYSSDGINMSGLDIGTGLQKNVDSLVTVFNPNIMNDAIYINDGYTDIQTGINNATAGDVISVSSGSFGGADITIANKQNIAIICPYRGQGSTICELAGGRGLSIANTSSTITINSLQIEGLLTLGATGNNYFTNLQCLGGITISAGATGNYFFYMSEIAGVITVPNTFAGVLFFSECNFAGASFSLNNVSPLQVQITQSLNLPTSRPVKATFSANNADTSQQITTNTKFLNDSQTNSGKYLSSDGANGIVWSTLPNLNSDANSVLYSVNGSDIKGDNNILKFEEDKKKLTVKESMSYVSASPIGVETAINENEFFTGVLAQNKDSSDGSSTHLLVTNDQGTDSSFYGGFDMFSSNSTIQFGQFATMPNALGISSQSSSIVITPNAGNSENQARNNNIMLTYDNGTKCHLINNNGQLVLGADNPSYSGDTYGGDAGENNKVLTSNGVSGLKWTPMGGDYSSYTNNFLSGQQTLKIGTSISLLTGSFANKLPDYPTIVDCVFNFSVSTNNTTLTITYTNNKDSSAVLYIQNLSRNGHHIFPVKFLVSQDGEYDYDFTITASLSTGSISTDLNDFYNAEFRQIKGALPV
jgi:hypothetical protein